MPRTTETGNAALQIELASPPGWTFTPGDTVIGTVLRTAPILTPDATVRLALVGRVKTKITTTGSSSRSKYRARWLMLGSTTAQILFRGPLHLGAESKGEGLSWSFSLSVPLRPAETAMGGYHSEEGFLPLDKDGISQHTLPGSFFSQNLGWRMSSEGFVEYFLEAWLRYHHRGGQFEVHRATCPVTIRPYPPVVIPSNDIIQHREIPRTIRSQRLLPGMECADLTLKQKAQRFLGSSKVPEVHGVVEISWPRIIQLGSLVPIPLTLNIIPQPEKTSESIRDIGLVFRVNWVSMVLKSTTTVLTPGDMRRLLTEDDSHAIYHYLNLENEFQDLETPLEFSAEEVKETGKKNPVDLGEMFNLSLHSHGLSAGDRLLASVPTIQPDIFTYNLRHSHLLKLAVSLTIAGETITVPLSADVMILAAD